MRGVADDEGTAFAETLRDALMHAIERRVRDIVGHAGHDLLQQFLAKSC